LSDLGRDPLSYYMEGGSWDYKGNHWWYTANGCSNGLDLRVGDSV